VKFTAVLATVAISVVLQFGLARYAVGGRWLFDVVLVGVVYAALNWGPVAGMLAGTLGGLIQDVLSDAVVGTGGLVKTLIGFAAGFVGAQFVVARPTARVAIVASASLLHRLLLVVIHGVIDQHWPAISWPAIVGETFLNSIFGLIAFQAAEAVPALRSRNRQSRRPGITRREW
jgi:rod shape-determining protein MreD